MTTMIIKDNNYNGKDNNGNNDTNNNDIILVPQP